VNCNLSPDSIDELLLISVLMAQILHTELLLLQYLRLVQLLLNNEHIRMLGDLSVRLHLRQANTVANSVLKFCDVLIDRVNLVFEVPCVELDIHSGLITL
jgi:hypothetical protein